MSDEPGGWELKRALSELRDDVRDGQKAIRDDVAKMVTQAAHEADIRRIEDQARGVADDLSAERQARVEAVALEREQRTIELNRIAANQDKSAAALQAQMEAGFKKVQEQMDRTATWVRWVAASVLVPVVLYVFDLVKAGSA